MNKVNLTPRRSLFAASLTVLSLGIGLSGGAGCGGSDSTTIGGLPGGTATLDQVKLGRLIVLQSGCADCHSGDPGRGTPDSASWLGGNFAGSPQGKFQLGPMTTVYAPNLTGDATGLKLVSDQKVFNALKFGLDPMDPANPDKPITSAPAGSHYLAPVMPWQSFRNHTDDELWALVAYIKHGIKPVTNKVTANVGDGASVGYWANTVAPIPGAFPLKNESFNP